MQKNLSRYWLLLGVSALAVAGLFALLLVFARTPSLSELPWVSLLFHQALVVHVDLSVLVWFLCIACLMWSLLVQDTKPIFPMLEEAALISFALGTLFISLSPLDTKAAALMSNYIPVLTSPVFFVGLSLLFCGLALMLLRVMSATTWNKKFDIAESFGIFSAAIITIIALMAFVWSFHQMPSVIDGQQYYDMLFWGGGHVLQFTHTQILLVCWLLLVRVFKPAFTMQRYLFKAVMGVGLATAFVVPFSYMMHDVASMEHRNFFTDAMMMVNGIGPIVMAVFILPVLTRTRGERKGNQRALWASLVMSVFLFLYGGFLGELIRGQNVVIPAHYHGSIVGVTLAFMGAAYMLLPQFGYKDVSNWKCAYWQPYVYGFGQLMHISGLAWSGGYGVLRKTPGGLANVSMDVKVAMGFMGLGGVIAVAGGLMFVIVMWKAIKSNQT